MPDQTKKTPRKGMVLHDVGDYERYKKVQVVANKLKHDKVFAMQENIAYLLDRFHPESVLCHGVRNGAELDYFTSRPGVRRILGTDIAPVHHPAAIQHDMHEPLYGLDPFDMVYSNSWDHTYDPEKLFKVWAEQVATNGCMILEHTSLHCPSHSNERDPFGVTREVLVGFLAEVLGDKWHVWLLTDAPNHHHQLAYVVARKLNGTNP